MKNGKKRNYNRFSVINTAAVLFALFSVGLLSLILPKPTVSEMEKRELAKKPQWSLSSWFSGEFAKQYDAYYADTFPAREKLVSVSSEFEKVQGLHPDDVRIHQGNQPTTPAEPKPDEKEQGTEQMTESKPDLQDYYDPNAPGNGLSGEGGGEQVGSLFLYQNMGMQIFGASKSLSERYAQAINSYAQELENVKVYNLIAPSSIAFYLPEKYRGISSDEKENIDYVSSLLSEKVTAVDAYSEIEKQKDDYIYFRTDHHWTVRGAYAAYLAFCQAADLEPVALSEMEQHRIDGFVGTFYNQTQDKKLAQTPDFVEYFVPPVQTETTRYERGKPFDPIESSIFASYATGGPNTYSVFLHGDFPLTHIKTDNHTGKKILLVKESFGNAFAPFLVSHYDEVFIVDQRYFELNLSEFVREKGITDLLFLNNIFAVNTELRIAELEQLQHQTYVPYQPPVYTPQPSEPVAAPEQPTEPSGEGEKQSEEQPPKETSQEKSEPDNTERNQEERQEEKKEEKPRKSLSQTLAEE